MAKITELRKAIKKHDFSYQYSDDHRWWLSGSASEDKIKKLAKGVDAKVLMKIWNTEVKKQYKGNNFTMDLATAREWVK